jgi:hypothetical protein
VICRASWTPTSPGNDALGACASLFNRRRWRNIFLVPLLSPLIPETSSLTARSLEKGRTAFRRAGSPLEPLGPCWSFLALKEFYSAVDTLGPDALSPLHAVAQRTCLQRAAAPRDAVFVLLHHHCSKLQPPRAGTGASYARASLPVCLRSTVSASYSILPLSRTAWYHCRGAVERSGGWIGAGVSPNLREPLASA